MKSEIIFHALPDEWWNNSDLTKDGAFFTDGHGIWVGSWWDGAWRCVYTHRCIPKAAVAWAPPPKIVFVAVDAIAAIEAHQQQMEQAQ